MLDFDIPVSFHGRPYAETHFRHIVQHAKSHHPFYRKFYANAQTIPLLTREILQAHNDELLNGHPVTGKTSGSTSVPVRTHWGPPRAKLDARDSGNYAEWFGGRLPNMKIVALTAHEANDTSFEVATPLPDQLRFIRRQIAEKSARALISYPTNLEQLAQYLISAGETVDELQRIICMSELFEPSQEAVMRRAFPQAVIGSTYSSTEVGMIAGRCPHHPAYHHLMAHKLGVELLDPEGKPCKEGEVGQVVITDYFNRRMPLIRYAIGDLAAPARCPCGKIDLPAITQLLGKQRGLLKHPDGHWVFSTELSPHIRDTPGIRQYQVEQLSPTHFTFRAIAQDGADITVVQDNIRSHFVRLFGQSLQMDFDWRTEIPRLPGGKYMEFIGLHQ